MPEEETPRMWIDLWPPLEPEIGDVWVRMGEWRVRVAGGWDPPWLPPMAPLSIPGYPKPGRRKKIDGGSRDQGR